MRHLLLGLALAAPAVHAATWHEFDYVITDRYGGAAETVAILLRAQIDGKRCWLQLDTGAPHVVLWQRQPGAGVTPVPVTVTVGDVTRTVPADPAGLATLGTPACMLGIVGNGFFEDGTLAVDFAGGRIAFAPRPALAHDTGAQPMLYHRSRGPGGHPLLPVTLADGRTGRMLIDTGAARFGVAATSAAHWQALTGLPLRDGGTVRSFVIANALDPHPLRCYEAPYAGTIRVGREPVVPEIVSYCEGKDLELGEPLLGVVGLRGLLGRQLTLDYVSQRWRLDAPGRMLE